MILDTSSRFQKFLLSDEELVHAKQVSPLTLAYIHTLRATYASDLVTMEQGEKETVDRYLRRQAEIQAKIAVLEELLDNLSSVSAGSDAP